MESCQSGDFIICVSHEVHFKESSQRNYWESIRWENHINNDTPDSFLYALAGHIVHRMLVR